VNDVTYRTVVYWGPPTPLGLLPGRWTIQHRCNLCREAVATDQLLSHAKDHSRGAIVTTGSNNEPVC